DLIAGDHGQIILTQDFRPLRFKTIFDASGGNDTLYGDAGDDVIFGGIGDDFISGGADSDRLLGDLGEAQFSARHARASERLVFITTGTSTLGGNDVIHGDDGCDYVIGAQGDDVVYGDAGDDIVIGDSAYVIFADGFGRQRAWVQ